MSSCCNTSTDLGCYGSCDSITLDYTALVDGTFTVNIIRPSRRSFTFDLTAGDDLVIPNNFNEYGVTVFQVRDTNNQLISIDGETCFKIEVDPTITTAITSTNESCMKPIIFFTEQGKAVYLPTDWESPFTGIDLTGKLLIEVQFDQLPLQLKTPAQIAINASGGLTFDSSLTSLIQGGERVSVLYENN